MKMPTDFGARLRLAMHNAGMGQTDLARAVGIKQSTVGTALTEGNGSRHTAQMAHALGVDAYWLATGEGHQLSMGDAQVLAREFDAIPIDSVEALRVRQSTYVQCLAAITSAVQFLGVPTAPEPPAAPPPSVAPRRNLKTRA